MRPLYRFLTLVTLVGGSTAAWLLPGVGSARADAPAVTPGKQRRQAIAFYERRLEEDPRSALDMAQLAALFMEEGRMAGDERAFVSAESLARKSLGERTRRNGRSAALLANALLAQHRFAEAAQVARDLVQTDPETPAYRALLAETLMELGDYAGAIRPLALVRAQREELGIAPRFARWAELTGQPGEARRILRAAQREAARRPDLSGEQKAWFSVRLADLELRHGHLRGASAAIEAGLLDSPNDWRLLLARGRLEAARGSWSRALRSAEEVIAAVPSPDALALLATAHQELGNEEQARSVAMALEGMARRPSGVIHRSWALALLDRGRDADAVVAIASTDTLVRQDVQTLDLLAWALHRAGRSAEALAIARRAIRIGSVEPSLRFHAGMIEFAGGDAALAERHLTVALRGRRALAPSQVAAARETLATLARRRK